MVCSHNLHTNFYIHRLLADYNLFVVYFNGHFYLSVYIFVMTTRCTIILIFCDGTPTDSEKNILCIGYAGL